MAQACPYNCKSGKVFNPVLKLWQPCPSCTGAFADLDEKKADTPDTYTAKLDDLSIPQSFRDAKFSPDNFFIGEAPRIFAPSTFVPVIEKLCTIEAEIKTGKPISESCYFYTGMYSGIQEYVYHCIEEAVKLGRSTVPYISLLELKTLRENKERLSDTYKYDYLSYTFADVCFIEATTSAANAEASILADLLAERSRHGLATVILGYWTEDMLKTQKSGIRFLISHETKRFSLLTPYAIQTRAKFNAVNAQDTANYNPRNGVLEQGGSVNLNNFVAKPNGLR